MPSQVCGASHEKDKFMNTHYYKIDRPRALRSLSHFEKPVDREMCSSLRRYAACFRACVMYVNGRCSLPATALFVCGPSRSCLSGRCSAIVRCRPVCSCRSSRALSCCRHALSVCVSGSCAADGPCWGLVCGPCGVRASPCASVYTYIHYIGLACQLSGPRPDRLFCFSNI